MEKPTDSSIAVSKEENYRNLLNELKSILGNGQAKAYKAVDNIKVQTYWQIGERIVREKFNSQDRADYGKYLVDHISSDLDIDKRELYRIIRFFRLYPIVGAVMPQLSWTHYSVLVDIENPEKRNFYQEKIIAYSWSTRELKHQINGQLYEKTTPEEKKISQRRKLVSRTSQLEIFKGSYDLGFIKYPQNEKELENSLIYHVEAFLNELGTDFCFVARQVPIKIDATVHYIDLLLYHKGIPCNILVELKTRKLDARDVGQMNKYVNYFRLNRQYEHEKETIGLIICSETGMEEVQYALGGLEEKIFIATYKPKLPSIDQLKKAVRNVKK
ncbi:MAG TPA: PDDEXK nuclease domain-containing protein [bacterium]|nr:PDDEXK nuclease domain-containing protein [bacterium]